MTKDALRQQRRLRVLEITILTLGAAVGILNILAGSLMVLVSVVTIAVMVWALRLNTKAVRRIKEASRPRPDYALIARMERDVYGETFQHEGAPAFTLTIGAGGVSMSALGEYGTARRRECIGCGYPRTIASGKCGACYKRAKRYQDESA